MSKKKKKRLIRKILLLILIIILFLFIKPFFKKQSNDNYKNYNEIKEVRKLTEITKIKENDSDIVKKFFAEGMSKNDYEKVITQEDNYIKSSEEYEKLSYNFEEKLHYSEIEEYILNLNKSDIVNVENIGSSVDNRNIYSIEIGKGTKTVLVDANIHAGETANTLILLKYMITIVNDYEDKKSSVVDMLNNIKFVVLPCINPDGYEVYNFGVESINDKSLWIYKNKDTVDFENMKFNANGVDINRNMPTQNAGLYYKENKLIGSVAFEKKPSGGAYFGGFTLGSEPETRSLMYFMLKHYKNTVAYLNMHSQGRVLYQGKPNLSDEFNDLCYDFAKKIKEHTNYIIYGLESEEVAQGNDGSATDFMAELANGLKYSSETGRLAMKSYKNKDVEMVYKYPVITIETLDRWTTNTKYYKDEYIYRNFKALFNDILTNYAHKYE